MPVRAAPHTRSPHPSRTPPPPPSPRSVTLRSLTCRYTRTHTRALLQRASDISLATVRWKSNSIWRSERQLRRGHPPRALFISRPAQVSDFLPEFDFAISSTLSRLSEMQIAARRRTREREIERENVLKRFLSVTLSPQRYSGENLD